MGIKADLKKLDLQLARMISLCDHADTVAPEVSAWSVGQHLEHLILAANHVAGLLERDCETHKGTRERLTWLGRLVLVTGYIRRGVGKSPRRVEPANEPRERTWLEASIAQLRGRFSSQGLAHKVRTSNLTDPHPYFGELSLARWLRFTVIHQAHHLRIIEDILCARELSCSDLVTSIDRPAEKGDF